MLKEEFTDGLAHALYFRISDEFEALGGDCRKVLFGTKEGANND